MSGARDGAKAHSLRFLPVDEAGICAPDETILDCARRMRVRLASSCGGHGTCMSCSVQFTDGAVPPPTAADAQAFSERRLKDGWRRACLTRLIGDSTVFIPARSTAQPVRTQVDGSAISVELDPPVSAHEFALERPTIGDVRADDLRLLPALEKGFEGGVPRFDKAVLNGLATDVRKWEWKGRLIARGPEIVAAQPLGRRVLGMAVDLGTTNVSAFLVDLESGETLGAKGCANPQNAYGSDLISYASFVRRKPEGAGILQGLAIEAINGLAADLCRESGRDPGEIVEMTVAGNTMMHHLALGLPIMQLAMSPFVPALAHSIDVKARELGVAIAPGGYVHFMPNIAGFVGGDHVATLLATMNESTRPVIVMDIGTNTELSIIENGAITSVSCPSGPAFEGGHTTCGMRAAIGAIETIRIMGGEVRLGVIGDGPPVGVCGSGVLDAVAQLYLAGILDERGRILEGHPRVRTEDGKRGFVLADETETGGPPVIFMQSDVRAIQLAKAAIRSATDLLLHETGHEADELDRVIIAGAFGNYIDVASAVAIGMLPDLPFKRFAQVGNAAGDGARQVLVSRRLRAEAENLARRCRYVEMAASKAFVTAFRERINLPPSRFVAAQA